nr:hypothetical protein [Granulicatella sp. zg-ZJ]
MDKMKPVFEALNLEGFSYAYGMDWLEDFFKENQDKLRRYY